MLRDCVVLAIEGTHASGKTTLTHREVRAGSTARDRCEVASANAKARGAGLRVGQLADQVTDLAERAGCLTGKPARMNRQAILYDEFKRLEFVIAEAALRWRLGPASLMSAHAD
jgi:Ni2+-binding GTPase involved in maturation of urease and hydrogenase